MLLRQTQLFPSLRPPRLPQVEDNLLARWSRNGRNVWVRGTLGRRGASLHTLVLQVGSGGLHANDRVACNEQLMRWNVFEHRMLIFICTYCRSRTYLDISM